MHYKEDKEEVVIGCAIIVLAFLGFIFINYLMIKMLFSF